MSDSTYQCKINRDFRIISKLMTLWTSINTIGGMNSNLLSPLLLPPAASSNRCASSNGIEYSATVFFGLRSGCSLRRMVRIDCSGMTLMVMVRELKSRTGQHKSHKAGLRSHLRLNSWWLKERLSFISPSTMSFREGAPCAKWRKFTEIPDNIWIYIRMSV